MKREALKSVKVLNCSEVLKHVSAGCQNSTFIKHRKRCFLNLILRVIKYATGSEKKNVTEKNFEVRSSESVKQFIHTVFKKKKKNRNLV